MDIRQ